MYTAYSLTRDRITVTRLGVSLLEICDETNTFEDLLSVRTLLAYVSRDDYFGQDGIAEPHPGTEIEFLFHDDQPWELGLSGSLGPERAKTIAENILKALLNAHVLLGNRETGVRFVKFTEIARGVGMRETTQAFGRAIGLCLLHGGNLTGLPLPLDIIKALHPHNRLMMRTSEDVTAMLGGNSTGSVSVTLGIISGIEQTLGPGGAELFSELEWLKRFGIDEVDASRH
jgi:hypothetical protein